MLRDLTIEEMDAVSGGAGHVGGSSTNVSIGSGNSTHQSNSSQTTGVGLVSNSAGGNALQFGIAPVTTVAPSTQIGTTITPIVIL